MMRTRDELIQMQRLPLEIKVAKTKLRIREWVDHYGENGVYVSFSGGKDSTVLLHIVREMYPNIEAVFVNTGLEYPEIQKFVKTFDNVTILRPKMRFDEVIKTYGYPMISKEVSKRCWEYRNAKSKGRLEHSLAYKEFNGQRTSQKGDSFFNKAKWKPLVDLPIMFSHKCCDIMKKKPLKEFEKRQGKRAIVGTMACESMTREQEWIKSGCNAFESVRPICKPLSFWLENDCLTYIKENNIEIASVYGNICYAEEPDQIRLFDIGETYKTSLCDRTGCIFCGFGIHIEKNARFLRTKETHPNQYQYCIGGGEFNEDGIWQPSKEGLGMGYVFDEFNKIYGEDFIKY